MNEKFLYKVKEAGLALGVSAPTIYRLIKEGRLVAVPIGGAQRITADSLKEYVASLQPVRKDA